MKLSSIIVTRNEDLLPGCISLIEPYCDEIIVVEHGFGIAKMLEGGKIKVFNYRYDEPVDMGEVRTFGLEKATGDWVWFVDADEYYPREACEKIREFIENPGEAISARVKYFNLAYRAGYVQDKFEHYPDRLYRRDVVDKCAGVLPDDMWHVKREFYSYRPYLEYDNPEDRSFENPKQPIIDATYYHLARTRGYNFELTKWTNYQKNLHPGINDAEALLTARTNGWVSGLYDMRKIDVPEGIPLTNIRNPKVSIVIPYYNYPQYIEKCVNSCLNQTVKPHEVILVNDCSPDTEIDDIVKQWKDNPIFIYAPRATNDGECWARNQGAEQATGDYLVFLDADDYIREDFIEKTLATIGDNDVCIPDMVVFNEANYELRFPDYTHEELLKQQIMPSTCCLYKTQSWLTKKFDPRFLYCDWELYLRMAEDGYTFTNCHEFLFFYNRKLDSNISKLDARKVEGLEQLQKYGIKPNL